MLRVGRPLNLHLEPRAEARAAEVEVVGAEVELAPEGDHGGARLAGRVEGGAEQAGETERAALGLFGLLATELGDQVEGVEEEVPIEARLEREQSCLLERALQRERSLRMDLEAALELGVQGRPQPAAKSNEIQTEDQAER